MKPSNPFTGPDYEDHLKALTRGPMTSDQNGGLIRPVDQLAEAVRSLHVEREAHAAEVAERDKQIETLHAVIAGDFNMKSFRKVCADNVRMRKAIIAAIEDYESCDGEGVGKAAMSTLRAALAAPPTAAAQAVEGMRKALEVAADDLEGCWQADLYKQDAEQARAALAAYEEAARG